MSKFRKHLLATAIGMAMAAGLSSNANASALPFSINPNSLGMSGYGTSVQATDIAGISDATILQVGPTTQLETGFVQTTGMTNAGTTLPFTTTGLINAPAPNTYDIYIAFTAVVNGISGFGPGQTGTMGAGDFNYTVYADVQQNNVMTPGSTGASPTNPSVTNLGDDLVLAQGTSVSGSAGFQATSGAPIFSVLASFDICNGTAGQATQGSVTVTASNCGLFDASNYFVAPVPFYSFQFTSTTSGSANNLTIDPVHFNATLDGIVTDTNFVPEPSSLALLGAALFGWGGLLGWRSRRT